MARYKPPTSISDIPSVQELIDFVDQTVSGLELAKKHLASLIRRHMIAGLGEDEGIKVPNLVVIGPTGGGKTHLIRTMLKASGAIYSEVNATEYSDVGYIGRDLTTMYEGLVDRTYMGDKGEGKEFWTQKEMIPLAERFGIVVIDEFDKLRMISKPGERQVGRALQAELLKLVEGATIDVKRFEGDRGFTFNTRRILHIAVGAFEGLPEIQAQIDGILDPSPEELAFIDLDVDSWDIHKYGFIMELMGRFPNIIPLPGLSQEAIARIVVEQVIPLYTSELAYDGIGFEMEQGAIAWLCGQSSKSKFGARSIISWMEYLLKHTRPDAVEGDTVAITAQSVQNSTAELIKGVK